MTNATPLFDGAKEHACKGCDQIFKTREAAVVCQHEHIKSARRDAARTYARTGVSQVKKPEAKA